MRMASSQPSAACDTAKRHGGCIEIPGCSMHMHIIMFFVIDVVLLSLLKR